MNSKSSTSRRDARFSFFVEQLDEAGNHRERTIDVVDDAGVDVAARLGDLFLDFLVLQFRQKFVDFFGAAVNFTFQHPPLHRGVDGAANGGDVERFVDVIRRAQPQRLPAWCRWFQTP